MSLFFSSDSLPLPIVCDTDQATKRFPWHGIRTRSNCEHIAATALEARGYHKYLPLYPRRRRWSDRVVTKYVPVFGGYVFCRFDYAQRLPVITAPGVVSVVGCGSEPAPIPDHEIEAIQTVLQSGMLAEPCPFLREGHKVRVMHGSLKGVEGILVKKKANWRLVVSINMLQRAVSVEVDGDTVTHV